MYKGACTGNVHIFQVIFKIFTLRFYASRMKYKTAIRAMLLMLMFGKGQRKYIWRQRQRRDTDERMPKIKTFNQSKLSRYVINSNLTVG